MVDFTKELDVIPTMHFVPSMVNHEDMVSAILEQYEATGIKRYLILYPSIGYLCKEFPPMEVFEQGGELFKNLKAAVAPYGIEIGWWITTTINSGPTPEFQKLVKPDGMSPPYSNCPLCKNLRERVSKSVARFAEIADPDFIFLEDDFSIGAQTGGMGCFCDAHMAEFERREGKKYTREELVSILKERTPEAFAINRRWRELIRDSLVGFATEIREELDKKSPHIPIGHMQPGSSDTEGDSTEAVARAFAGKNHIPHARFWSCFYGMESPNGLPASLFNPLYKKQHTGEGFGFYHESDAWPRNRFFRSSSFMRAAMGSVYSYGYDGSTFNDTQATDNQNEEKAYFRMYGKEKARFTEANRIAKQCEVVGVGIEYDPFFSSIYGPNPEWITKISLYGIPITSKGAKIAFWDKAQASYMEDEAIMKALSGGLFLDGAAAKILYDRGYGKYLGVEVGEQVCKKAFFNDFSPDSDPFSFDLGAKVFLTDKYSDICGGRGLGGSGYGYSPTGVKGRYHLTPCDKNCEIVSNLYGFEGDFVTVASTVFKNSLGGTVVVFGGVLGANFLENYREQKLIQHHILECCDDIAFAKDEPNIFVIMNEAKEESADFFGMLTVTNLCEDNLDEFFLHIPKKWLGFSELCSLGKDGKWTPLNYTLDGQTLTVKEKLNYLDPVYILVK